MHLNHMLNEVDNILTVTEQEKAARKQQEMEKQEAEKQLRILDGKDKRKGYQRKLDEELELQRLERFKKEHQTVKLPKLTITPFKGTCLDWFRFWEQFEAEVDKPKSFLIYESCLMINQSRKLADCHLVKRAITRLRIFRKKVCKHF